MITCVWSLFRRSIIGVFNRVNEKHIARYLEELEWQFNNRYSGHSFREMPAGIVCTKPVTYGELVD